MVRCEGCGDIELLFFYRLRNAIVPFVNSRIRALVDHGNAQLRAMGAEPASGRFVCPMCLRLVDEAVATQGHYPAQAVAALRRHTELLCSDCNGFCGTAFEDAAAEFWQPLTAATFGMAGTGRIRGRVKVENVGGAIQLGMHGKPSVAPVVAQWRSRSADPHTLEVSLSRPLEVSVRRSLLAWSYLAWVHYAGYRYAASAGAEIVRRLILEPERPLPPTVVMIRTDLRPPLPAPEPSLLCRVAKLPADWPADFVEFYGVGATWGSAVVVMPFANDDLGACWERLAMFRADPDARVVELKLRTMFDVERVPPEARIDKGIRAEVAIEQDGVRKVVAESAEAAQVAELAAGRSPRRIESHIGRVPPSAPRRFQEFTVIEGRPPRRTRRHPARPVKVRGRPKG